jgi:hypothetical protein
MRNEFAQSSAFIIIEWKITCGFHVLVVGLESTKVLPYSAQHIYQNYVSWTCFTFYIWNTCSSVTIVADQELDERG